MIRSTRRPLGRRLTAHTARATVVALLAAPVVLGAPQAAHAESWTAWAMTQAEACSPNVQDLMGDPLRLQFVVSGAACFDASKPVDDTTYAGEATAVSVVADAETFSPTDMIDALAGVTAIQAASLSDIEYRVHLNATNPNLRFGAASGVLGIREGYSVSASPEAVLTYVEPSNLAGCLSGCGITVENALLQEEQGGGTGNGGNSPNKMTAFDNTSFNWDPAKNNNRANGYGTYYYFKADHKWRSDMDYYGSSMDASVGKSGDNRLRKVHVQLIPGRDMQLVEGAPREMKKQGNSLGTTTIGVSLKGELGNDKAKGGSEIGLSRSYERYEGTQGGGYFHDGTHFVEWKAGNNAGTVDQKSVDGVTTWAVPTNTSAKWTWSATATTCDNPCWND